MFRNIFLLFKSMLELIISFSPIYWISNSLWICLQTSSNSSNVVDSTKISGNIQKMFVNNELLQKSQTELDYFFSMIMVNFYFLIYISIYVIVMRIFKCEKVFAEIFILIENKLEKVKSQQKLFRKHDTHFNNIYSFIQFYSNYLKAGR